MVKLCIYGCDKQQIENLNWAMSQLEGEDADCRCLVEEDDKCFQKAERIGSAILFIADERAKYYKEAKANWNEEYNGHEYNIKVEVARID